ncbi:response regulator [Sorangium sp. So ce1389]|uniref:response regulator n=1 Tax=Sorangium sp. So ce1389 TaxID=3133336 RepID=UPI003F5DBB5C
MPSGVVLVIEDEEYVADLLATAIREAGYEVIFCATAEAGLSTACTLEPECIVCDIGLPDHDGYWVARNVRTQPSRVSVTPFLFLSALDDQQSRLEGFHVGADVYMTKPFRVSEVVAQIGALVQMASRLRQRRDSLMSIPASVDQTAIEGDLSQMSIATVLTVLEMERRSGVFEVTSKKRRAQLDIAEGCIVQGTVGGTRVSALAALRTMLGWKVGRFAFIPGSRPVPSERKSIAAYLLEATRLEDESTRVELEIPPSRRRPEPRFATTALGGPSSLLEDVAPPSSRAPLSSHAAIEERLRLGPGVTPRKGPDSAVSISAAPPAPPAPPSLELNFELEPAPAGTPPTLRSLARMAKPPSSRRGAESEPPTLPRGQGRASASRPPSRRPAVPPPSTSGEGEDEDEDELEWAEMDAHPHATLAPPTTQRASLHAPPRTSAVPQPPRPAPPRPPRPDSKKR